jgi:hypothetical protein
MTLTNIYRGAAESGAIYNEEASLEKFSVENDWEKLDGVIHVRCFSLKPHACESYDFDYRRRIYFQAARSLKDF